MTAATIAIALNVQPARRELYEASVAFAKAAGLDDAE